MKSCFSRTSLVFFVVFLAIFSAAGPVTPTLDVRSQSSQTTGEVPKLDLPYKPIDIEETITVTEDGTDETDGKKTPVLDWSKVPFVALKFPHLGLAPDPEL